MQQHHSSARHSMFSWKHHTIAHAVSARIDLRYSRKMRVPEVLILVLEHWLLHQLTLSLNATKVLIVSGWQLLLPLFHLAICGIVSTLQLERYARTAWRHRRSSASCRIAVICAEFIGVFINAQRYLIAIHALLRQWQAQISLFRFIEVLVCVGNLLFQLVDKFPPAISTWTLA